MATMEEVRQSIKDLAETQKKGMAEVDQKIKEVAEVQRQNAETQRQFAEAQRKQNAETQRQFAEIQREFAEARKKSIAEVDQKIKEVAEAQKELTKTVNKVSGDFGNTWGQFVEDMVTPNVVKLLKKRGIEVVSTAREVRRSKKSRWEIDILAINGKELVAIEVKKRFRREDIADFMESLALFKQEWGDCSHKVLYGAIAFVSCEEKVENMAEEKGLFVFQATGESAAIINPLDFKPMPIEIVPSPSPQNK